VSKGDTPRPLSVPREQYESAWDRTFGRKETAELERPAWWNGTEPVYTLPPSFLHDEVFADAFRWLEERSRHASWGWEGLSRGDENPYRTRVPDDPRI
jgi:hypothetical protein